MTEPKFDSEADGGVPAHVGHHIRTIAALVAKAEQGVGRHQQAIERMTDVLGTPASAYAAAIAMAAWILANAAAPKFGLMSLDAPPFPWLQGAACIAALLVTMIILTTQNRAAKLAQQRAHLDLEVNLIAEEKIAKLIALVEELRRDLPLVKDRKDSQAEAMAEALDVHAVAHELDAIHSADKEGGPRK